MQKVKYKEKAQAGLIDDCVDPVAGVEGGRGGGVVGPWMERRLVKSKRGNQPVRGEGCPSPVNTRHVRIKTVRTRYKEEEE